jgi:hypothetical protein
MTSTGTLPQRLIPFVLLAGAVACTESAGDADGLGGQGGLGGGEGSGGAPLAAPEGCAAPPGLFALAVLDHAFGSGQDVGQEHFPALVLGPPYGAGETSGSTDHVVSLGDGGFVELSFGEYAIVDAPGPDFLVFENAFFAGGDPEQPWAEFGQVSVSQDGSTWIPFPCKTEDYPYETCAGWHPVLANAESNELDATDPEAAGGDPFDLASLDLRWVRYVRIDDLVDDKERTFDLDAVAVVHPGCF